METKDINYIYTYVLIQFELKQLIVTLEQCQHKGLIQTGNKQAELQINRKPPPPSLLT